MSKYKSKHLKSTINNKTYTKSKSIYLLLPIMFILVFLPLIVRMHTFSTGITKYDWAPNAPYATDLFLYYKQWFFVFVAGVIVLIIGIRALIDKQSIKFSKIFCPLFLYAFLALISTIVSKYRYFGFHGYIEQFENIFCIIGYVLVIYYCYLTITSEYELQILIDSFAIGALLVGVLGTFQAFRLNYFNNPFFQSIIFQKGTDMTSLNFAFYNNRVYSTLFNPNYVGVYTSIVIPLFFTLLIFSHRFYQYILYSSVLLTSVISLFGSESKTTLISLFITVFIAVLIFRKRIIKLWYIIVPLLLVLALIFVFINHVNNNNFTKVIRTTINVQKSEVPDLSSVITSKDNVSIVFKQNSLNISLDSDHHIVLSDKNDQTIAYQVSEAIDEVGFVIQPQDIRFSDLMIVNYTNGSAIDFALILNDTIYPFSHSAIANTYSYYNRFEKFSPFVTAESIDIHGYENFGSGRGYIWSRTIPLLKKYILLGCGADSFAFAFPQYDYLNLDYYGKDAVLSKPHNLYLQIAIQSGFISLCAYLVFFAIYLAQSFKLYFNCSFHNASEKIGVAILLCTISFLISGLANDSSIVISPVFYAVLGVGIAANSMNKSNILSKDN